ncbi:GIY-YIG nuclease family protein [Flavobacterium urocaniciphilum]|uniref:Putative endonuclease n=1 Tax=Flavobacterium urocaniciphilum TaxID=1299341 RepID=A0A1H9AF49_9FLAO|nr:GIY-YIG nuclease family protein [Flavobacterium urocaniciphilum]SEP75364.1 putative endonuclease [Flavobacterium urocaniciphilum]
MFIVYFLYSEIGDVYYKGFTTNIETRLQYHLLGKSKFTSRYSDWRLVYSVYFDTKSEALREEKRLKRLNRLSIEKLITK